MPGVNSVLTTALPLAVGLAIGCVSDLGATRDPVDQGTFGDTVFTLSCKRIAYLEDLADGDGVVDVRGDEYRDACRLGLAPPDTAPDSLKAFLAKRDQLVTAIDTTFPEDALPDVQTFLTSPEFLALYDSGDVVASVDDLVEMLRFAADDDALSPALARLTHRAGYLPARDGLGALRAVASYPELHSFLRAVIGSIAPGGEVEDELRDMVDALGVTLRNARATQPPVDDESTGAIALRLLTDERPMLGGSDRMLMVRRDRRGVAKVAVDATGAPVAPFADEDADGLADVDDLGRFVDVNGDPISYPAPFEPASGDPSGPTTYRDLDGRALDAPDGAPLYEYADLDGTLLSALARDGRQLFDPDRGTALDLFRGASALLSTRPRVPVTRRYENGERLDYRGYDLSDSPLLDMLYGYLSLLTYGEVDDVLAVARALVVEHERETARVLEAFLDAREIAAAHDEARIDPRAPFADDLIPLIREILAVPGLAEDIMLALEDPALADLDARLRDYMTYADQFVFDADQNLVGSFATPVDRTAPDVGYNRSLMQRLLHLIEDANGASLCNKQDGRVTDPLGLGIPLSTYDECELIHIENVALLYVQSMAYQRDASGRFTCRTGVPSRNAVGYWRCPDGARPVGKARLDFHWNNFLIELVVNDDLIEAMTTIEGFSTRPTPESLTRALFLDPMPVFLADVMDPGLTKHGERFIDVHNGTLPVFEANSGYDAIQPLVQAFADHDAERLFVRLLAVLHKHWPSDQSQPTHQFDDPDAKGYVWGSGAVSYEPAIIEILEQGAGPSQPNLVDALRGAAPVINHMVVDDRESVDVLVGAARYAFAPSPGLSNRRGATTSQTIEGDPIAVLSPVQLILDAYAIKRDGLDATGDEGRAWQRAVGNLADVFLRGAPLGGGDWRFANPRTRGVAAALVDFLRERLREHDRAGDRTEWLLTALPDDIETLVTGPVFASTADFVAAVHARPETRRQLELLVAFLLDEAADRDAFRLLVASTADLVQLALDDRDIIPIAHVIGEALKPERGWVDSQLALVHAAVETDQTEALARTLRQLFDDAGRGRTAVGSLIDGISEVHRDRPYVDLGANYTATDYRALFRGVAQFLDDNKRGLRRFTTIVQSRHAPTP